MSRENGEIGLRQSDYVKDDCVTSKLFVIHLHWLIFNTENQALVHEIANLPISNVFLSTNYKLWRFKQQAIFAALQLVIMRSSITA